MSIVTPISPQGHRLGSQTPITLSDPVSRQQFARFVQQYGIHCTPRLDIKQRDVFAVLNQRGEGIVRLSREVQGLAWKWIFEALEEHGEALVAQEVSL